MVVVAGYALLELADLEEVLGADPPAELRDEGDVLAHVARELPELGVLLDEALHVGYRLDVGVVLGARLVLLDVVLDVAAQVAKVEVHVLLEEGVLVLRQHDLAELGPDVGHVAQVDAAVVDAEQVVHHGLVRPLHEQGRDGVLPAVDDQQDGRRVDPAEVEELVLLAHAVAHLGGELLGERAVPLVADQRLLLEAQEDGDEALGGALQRVGVPRVRAAAPDAVGGQRHVEREEVRVDDDVVEEVLLDQLDHLVVVGLGEALEGGLLDHVAEEEVVLAVLGLAQLVDEQADGVGVRPHEAQAAQMAHLLAVGVVEAVHEVDLVVEQGRLRDCRRHEGQRLAVQQQDLHLGRRRRRRALAGRHHLGDVARRRLHDVHGVRV